MFAAAHGFQLLYSVSARLAQKLVEFDGLSFYRFIIAIARVTFQYSRRFPKRRGRMCQRTRSSGDYFALVIRSVRGTIEK
jgi:hypothetical protein